MAVYNENGKWLIKGKIKKDDGSYYNYKRIVKDAKQSRDAKDFETDFIRAFQDIELSKKKYTFKELVDEYLEKDTNVKYSTKKTKKDVLKQINEKIGSKKINLITSDMLQKYIKELEIKYSFNYVSKFYYLISSILKYAIDQDYIKINPMQRVKITIQKDKLKEEMLFFEQNDFDRFILNADEDEYKIYFMFLYYMGTRKSEARALKWKDIDFDNNTVYIKATITDKANGKAWDITPPKTANSYRNISMPDALKESLTEWKEYCKTIYGYSEETFVFGFYKPLSRTTIDRKLEKYKSLANHDKDGKGLPLEKHIPNITVHGFRHSHASYLINNMTDKYTDYDAAKRLGMSVDMLHHTYAHWFKQADKKIIDVINNTNKKDMPRAKETTSKYGDLKELKELLDLEIITQDEFDLKKKEILGI